MQTRLGMAWRLVRRVDRLAVPKLGAQMRGHLFCLLFGIVLSAVSFPVRGTTGQPSPDRSWYGSLTMGRSGYPDSAIGGIGRLLDQTHFADRQLSSVTYSFEDIEQPTSLDFTGITAGYQLNRFVGFEAGGWKTDDVRYLSEGAATAGDYQSTFTEKVTLSMRGFTLGLQGRMPVTSTVDLFATAGVHRSRLYAEGWFCAKTDCAPTPLGARAHHGSGLDKARTAAFGSIGVRFRRPQGLWLRLEYRVFRVPDGVHGNTFARGINFGIDVAPGLAPAAAEAP